MNLATSYLGLKLANPIVVGASPFCDDLSVARQLQDAGAAAVVMRSLFAEQFDPSVTEQASLPAHDSSPATVHFPACADYQFSPEKYLRQLEGLKRTLSIPVLASLNGHRPGGWTDYARQLESAGADAIELNIYQVVTNASVAADQIETEILETLGSVAGSVRIPVAVKLSPFYTSVAQLALALELRGAAGLVVFNRVYQSDVNLKVLQVQPQLRLSDPGELLLRLRWLAILSPNLRGSLSAAGGVLTSEDIAMALLTGAHTVQLVSVLLEHGPHLVYELLTGLEDWMRGHGFTDIDQFRGMLNLRNCPDAAAFERASYIRILQRWKI